MTGTTDRSSLAGPVMFMVIVFWGLGPPISKLISAPAVLSVFYRFWLSVPILLLMARIGGHRVTRDSLRRSSLAGIAFGINLCFVFLTFDHAAIAVLSVITSLQPGVILLVSGRLFGERATRWHVAWTLIGIGGTVIVVLGAGDDVDTDLFGILFATAALFTFTIYFLITKHVRSSADLDPIQWIAGVTMWAALAVTPLALLSVDRDGLAEFGGDDWIWLAFIVMVTGIAGHVLMSWVTRFIAASRSSLYLLSMNIVAISSAWLIHDETITLIQFLGGVVVFGAVTAVISRPPERVALAPT